LKKDYLQARDLFRVAAIIRPEAAWPHYLIAQALAELNDNKAALEELNKAVDLGLNNPELLDSPEFARLRENIAFKDLQARAAQNQAKLKD
jgi:tetratricopeptide (TPR) repeat protein